MNRRVVLGAAALVVVVGIGIWLGTRTPKPVAPTETERAVAPPSTPQLPAAAVTAVAVPPAPAPALPGTVEVAAPSTPAGPPPVASSVVPGSPMVRATPKPARAPAEAAGPTIPPRPVTHPEARADIENIRLMLRDFRARLGENPVGSNAEIMKALMGGNPAKVALGPPAGQSLNAEGELVDRWGTPIFFHQLSKNEMEIRSAGPDRVMWTRDDLIGK